MTTSLDSQNFDSFVPVYDVIPEEWEESRPVIVEQLKKLSNAINIRQIGWYLDVELLSGGLFVPSGTDDYETQPQYRAIFRKVIVFGPIVTGSNSMPHGIVFDDNFSLIDLWASATENATPPFKAVTFSNSDTINMDDMNINITSDQDYNICYAFVEYILEP
jgi:hypothetical protein